jgi:Probable zinc-ribbon domain
MGYLARNLNCYDCKQSFPFSVEEKGLGAELGFDDPRRCKSCRLSLEKARRAFRDDTLPPLQWLHARILHRPGIGTKSSRATAAVRA